MICREVWIEIKIQRWLIMQPWYYFLLSTTPINISQLTLHVNWAQDCKMGPGKCWLQSVSACMIWILWLDEWCRAMMLHIAILGQSLVCGWTSPHLFASLLHSVLTYTVILYSWIPNEAVLIYMFFFFCCQKMTQVLNSDWNSQYFSDPLTSLLPRRGRCKLNLLNRKLNLLNRTK